MTTAVAAMQEKYAEAGLPMPLIPAGFLPALRVLDEWVMGTSAGLPWLYNLKGWLDAYLNGHLPASLLAFGHAGHGINSYAFHYYLVREGLALFSQIAWGGVDTDDDAAVDMMRRQSPAIEELLADLDSALSRGLLPPGDSYVVVMSDFHGRRWTRVRIPAAEVDWVYQPTVLSALYDAHIDIARRLNAG